MKKLNKTYMKNKNYQKNSSLNKNFFADKILKFSLAIALFIFLSFIVNAGDVIVEGGKLDVSSNLYVDAAGKVGIGTPSPIEKFDVAGGRGSGGMLVRGSVSNFNNLDGKDAVMIDNDAANVRIISPTGDGIAFYPGKVQKVTIDSSGKLQVAGEIHSTSGGFKFPDGTTQVTAGAGWTEDSTGNKMYTTNTERLVGIGTNAPNRKLYVKDTADNVLVVDGGASKYSALDFYDNAVPKWGVGKNPSDNFYIDRAGVGNAITILGSNRNVGVGGITNPSEKLDVAGNVKGTGLCIGSDCRTSWPSGGSGLPSGTSGQTLRHDGTNWVANSVLQNNGIDTVTIQRGDEATLKITNTGAGGKSWALISSGSGGLGGAGKFSIYDTSEGGNSRLLIDTNGNVGIGTTSPDSRTKLQIVNGWLKVSGTNHGDPASRIGVGNNWWMSENTNGFYAIHQNGVGDKLTVDTSGNVGIGTTGPSSKLHIAGGGVAVGPFAMSNSEGALNVAGSVAELGFVRRNLASWPATPVAGDRFVWYSPDGTARLWTHGNGDLMTITNTGNVGIGTSPTSWAKLDVAGDVSVRGASNWGGTDVAVITSEAVGKPLAMKARGGVAPDLVVTPSGNVGIGTTSPGAKLEVGASGDILLKAIADDPGDIIFQNSAGTQKARIWSEPAAGLNKLHLSSGDNTPDITVDAAGNVGIGTTNPTAKVTIRGGIDDTLDLVSVDGSRTWDIYVNPNGNLYFVKFDGGLDAKFGFEPGGRAIAENGPWTTGGVDFAEYLEQLNEGELQPYDLVCLGGDKKVKKCKDSETPIGIISTNPAFVGGDSFEQSKKDNPKYALVGLIGQVTLRIYHNVKAGDIVAPDKFAKIIALEDGKAGEIIRVLVK